MDSILKLSPNEIMVIGNLLANNLAEDKNAVEIEVLRTFFLSIAVNLDLIAVRVAYNEYYKALEDEKN
ncbi:MAG: hypothetical protein ACRDD2_11440 [Sarcina sp.]